MIHPVLAKQASCFIPLAADTVKQVVLIRFFGGGFAVFVPSANHPLSPLVPEGNSFTELSVSIIILLNGGAHRLRIRHHCPPHLPATFNTIRFEKPTENYSLTIGNSRGANSTHPHERHCEAPMREARQAAPDWARAAAALSSSKNSQFSRGTWPLRRKDYGFVAMSYNSANSIAEVISNKFHRRLQHSCEGRQTSRRPATIPSDENLKANPRRRRKAQGGTEATTRSILELSAAVIQYKVVFIAVTATSRLARQAHCNWVKISERRNVL